MRAVKGCGGLEAIVDDELTASFAVEELPFWNLLSRNKDLYSYLNWRLQVCSLCY